MRSYVFILTLISFFPVLSFGQDWDGSCDDAIENANKDFASGIMKATSYGLLVIENYDFESFYDDYLWDKYRVESSDGGCVVTEYSECYSSRMFELIKQKYGKNFFKKTRKEARKLHKPKESHFEDDFTPSHSNDGTYTVVDSMPQYPGGMRALIENTNAELAERIEKRDSLTQRSFALFVIDTLGNPTEVKIVRGADPIVDSALVDILRKMPKWKPGKNKSQKVRVKMVLPFRY